MKHVPIAQSIPGKIFEWCFGYLLLVLSLPIIIGAIIGAFAHIPPLFNGCSYIGYAISTFERRVLTKLFVRN